MAARSPLDPLAGILPVDAQIKKCAKHELIEWIYSLAEQLASARTAIKSPRPPKGFIYVAEADLPAALFIPLPEGRVLGETQRIESIVDDSDAYRCAMVLAKAYIAAKKPLTDS